MRLSPLGQHRCDAGGEQIEVLDVFERVSLRAGPSSTSTVPTQRSSLSESARTS
jgi:hypothetical protein